MKIVGICGSPRKNGNSEILLDEFLKYFEGKAEIEKIFLNKLRFVPCQECENIRKDGRCKINDDMQNVYDKIESSDIVIVASPIFFGSISAQTKMMIDRFQCQWLGIKIFKTFKPKRKRGIFISVEASEKDEFIENAKSIIKNFFATIGASYFDDVICKGVDEKGKVKEKIECFEKIKKIYEKIMEV
ncbi:MAG: flavodoxin family protein [Candidatus Omnitrophica bacterium]|nr:flavodoxin family protein [Candidatus Omnitrophota bacterium]MCM8810590.1 flavodoxin family protein [Candidatus Omnitrophota bacterium]